MPDWREDAVHRARQSVRAWENGHCERLNSKLWDELPNGEMFTVLREAEVRIENRGTPSGHTCRSAADHSHRKPSCCQPVACPTLRSGQPTGWPKRSDSNSRTVPLQGAERTHPGTE
jgi:hypothetical protein